MTDALDMLDSRASFDGEAMPAGASDAAADTSDDMLMMRFKEGDAGSFELLYERHKGPVYRFFLRQLPQAQAHDSFQDTWTKLISGSDRFEPRGTFQAYLFRLAHNVLVDHHRKNMRAPVADGELEQVAGDGDVAEQAGDDQLLGLLHDEIGRLPLNQRTVWLMKQETELSLTEIAHLTGTTLEGVKSRLRYANAKLKAGMQRYVRT